MKKEWLVKIIALSIVVLFISVSFQPIIAEKTVSVEKESDIENVDFKEAKEYLFQTIIDIADNPNVKILFKQYNHKIFTSDYDYKSVFSQLLFKKPRLLKSMLFTRPKLTYEYLETSYKRGLELINILGEKKSSKIVESVKITNPKLFDELKCIIMSDEKLSEKIAILGEMNDELEPYLPFKYFPVICAILIIIVIILWLQASFFSWIEYLSKGTILEAIFDTIFFITAFYYSIGLDILFMLCGSPPYPPGP